VQPGRLAVAKFPMRCQASTMDFRRPRNGRIIAGVCAGIARRYGWEVSTARLLALLTFLLPGPNVLIYVVLWILTPSSDDF
jgi:phage shock protein C